MNVIQFYSVNADVGCFSNFSPHPVRLKGKAWPTSEHYFQAQKFAGTPDEEEVRQARSPMIAARMGRSRKRPLRKDWESVKDQVMHEAVVAKFTQHADLREILLGTGDATIVEHTENDGYWGDGGDGSGRNRLGEILMRVREELRAGPASAGERTLHSVQVEPEGRMSTISPSSRPTPTMIRLCYQLQRLLGEPTALFVFDAAERDHPVHLPLLHVPTWAADEHCDVTGLNTLGMSERPIPGTNDYAELHLGFRGRLTQSECLDLARLLANVAEYPFENDLKLGWWEIIPRAGRIPGFTGCRHLLLHPKLAEGGIEQLEDDEGPVKLIYVVPITPYERHLLTGHGRSSFLQYVEENGVDLLADRHDRPEWYDQP